MKLLDENLIPPSDLLFDGSAGPEEFVKLGEGFLWNLLVARARLKPNHAILDVGSGNGQKARPLARYLDQEGRYYGFDVVEEGVNWCKQRYAQFENFRFDFANVKNDWYSDSSQTRDYDYVFPYEDETIDVAFMASVATHLLPAGLGNYLRQSFRVIRKGGCLLMTCFLINEINKGLHRMKVQGETFDRYSEECYVLDKSHPSRGVAYSELYLRQLCNEIGFITSEMTFGIWSNGIDRLSCLQDTMILVKPE